MRRQSSILENPLEPHIDKLFLVDMGTYVLSVSYFQASCIYVYQ